MFLFNRKQYFVAIISHLMLTIKFIGKRYIFIFVPVILFFLLISDRVVFVEHISTVKDLFSIKSANEMNKYLIWYFWQNIILNTCSLCFHNKSSVFELPVLVQKILKYLNKPFLTELWLQDYLLQLYCCFYINS